MENHSSPVKKLVYRLSCTVAKSTNNIHKENAVAFATRKPNVQLRVAVPPDRVKVADEGGVLIQERVAGRAVGVCAVALSVPGHVRRVRDQTMPVKQLHLM